MITLTLGEIAAAVDGRLVGADPERPVTGPVIIDSREAAPGTLFVAFPGERVDGRTSAAAAVAAGAVAVVCADPPPAGVPAVVVGDPQLALGRLARAVRDRLPELTVVGVTGSSGKTSTKDLLAHLLPDLGVTVAPRSSFNNEIGVPLTALRCDGRTRYLVSEMGAREPGNIAYLCDLVAPRIGLVLNVGAAHAGVFGSREATAATKGELVEALPAAARGGVAVLNADDPAVSAMAGRTAARVVTFGVADGEQAPRADVTATQVRLDALARATFTLRVGAGVGPGVGPGVDPGAGAEHTDQVTLRLHGAHHVANAVAAAAVAVALGMAPGRVAELLGTAEATSAGRMAVHRRSDGVVVVDDAYNANPDSVAAALSALVAMAGPGGRAWAVLGEMLELGDSSAAEHERLGALAVRSGCRLVAVGEGGRPYLTGVGTAASTHWVPDGDAARDLLAERLAPGDVVLVKASRAVGLDRLAAALLTRDDGPAPDETPEPAAVRGSRPVSGQDDPAVPSGDGVVQIGAPSRHPAHGR